MGEPRCQTCQFWVPKFYQNGRCVREFNPHSKIWNSNGEASIMTDASFSCSEYHKITNTERDTV